MLKVGDKAKRVRGRNGGSEIGHVAVVSRFEDGGEWAVFDDGGAYRSNAPVSFHSATRSNREAGK